jgi:uncharacterized protein (TIGR03546 family)
MRGIQGESLPVAWSLHRKGFRMLRAVVAPFRRAVKSLVASNSPGQLAAGFALGMMIGIMPKSNLIALSLCVLLFSLRCNKGLGLVAAVLFSCFAGWTDPFAHRLGLSVLSAPSLQANYASVFTLPLGPWLGFHNTVVCGSFLMGLYVAYPVYWLVKTLCGGFQRRAAS